MIMVVVRKESHYVTQESKIRDVSDECDDDAASGERERRTPRKEKNKWQQ